MYKEMMLKRLKQKFGLKEKHLHILKALDNKKLEASQISKSTEIPMGRVYTYLNELVNHRLIQRSPKRPYTYELTDLRTNVLGFMKTRIDDLITAQREVIDLMKEGTPDQVELINTKGKFTATHVRLIAGSKEVKLISIHRSFPFLLYPSHWQEFLKVRKQVMKYRPTISFTDTETAYLVYKTYSDALAKGTRFRVLLDKDALDDHLSILLESFGQEYVQNYIKDLHDKLEKYRIQARVLEEKSPMEINIGDREVALSLVHLQLTTGLLMTSQTMVQFYTTYFEKKWIEGTSIPLK